MAMTRGEWGGRREEGCARSWVVSGHWQFGFSREAEWPVADNSIRCDPSPIPAQPSPAQPSTDHHQGGGEGGGGGGECCKLQLLLSPAAPQTGARSSRYTAPWSPHIGHMSPPGPGWSGDTIAQW